MYLAPVLVALQHPHQLEVGAGEDGDLGLDPELK